MAQHADGFLVRACTCPRKLPCDRCFTAIASHCCYCAQRCLSAAVSRGQAAERELEQGMWPTLYMLQAFVRDFVATPLPAASASH